MPAHGDDAFGPTQLGCYDSAQTHRSIAHDHDRVAFFDLGSCGCMITRGHHVGEGQQRVEHVVAVVLRLAWNLHQRPIRVGESQILALVPAAPPPVRIKAVTVEAGPAGRAVPAAMGEWRYDEVTRFDMRDIRSHLLDQADSFVPYVTA